MYSCLLLLYLALVFASRMALSGKMGDVEVNIRTTELEKDGSASPVLPTDSEFTSAEESALLRKLDWRIIPILSVMYILMLIDRVNIGNVKIEGILKDLHMAGNDYNMALLVHTIPFIFFELPSSLMLRRIRPGTWLAVIMFGWGMYAASIIGGYN